MYTLIIEYSIVMDVLYCEFNDKSLHSKNVCEQKSETSYHPIILVSCKYII